MGGIIVFCLSLGDSLAVGVGQQLPQCRVEAEVGITSSRYLIEHRLPHFADRVVISLGVNDAAGTNTLENLARVRSAVSARSVIWLLPFGHPAARVAIQTIARRFGDRTIDTGPFVGGDKLHPTDAGYRTLAQMVSMPFMTMARRFR
jgi:lysophospholipase L1-like esterase